MVQNGSETTYRQFNDLIIMATLWKSEEDKTLGLFGYIITTRKLLCITSWF